MSSFNPLSGSILQSIQTQRQLGMEKERQVRREQVLEKDIAAEDDRFEHQVESADVVNPTDDHGQHPDPKKDPKRQRHKDEESGEEPGIDVKA